MTDRLHRELDELIDAILEQRIDNAGWARLNTLLDGNTDAQHHYLQRVDLHNTLHFLSLRMVWRIRSVSRAVGI